MRERHLREHLRGMGIPSNTAWMLAGHFFADGIEAIPYEYREYIERWTVKGTIGGRDVRQETICQLHRRIYRALKSAGYTDDSDEIMDLRKAFDCGKKMNAKLRQYKEDYDDGWYNRHKREGGELEEHTGSNTEES